MPLYNVTGFDNITNPLQVATAANDLAGGWVFGLILLVIAVVIFMVFKNNVDTKAVLVGDSFICTILAIIMWGVGLIGYNVLIWPILFLFGSLIALIFWPD